MIQVGFLGCWGEEVDAIDRYTEKIEGLTRKVKPPPLSKLIVFDHLVAFIITLYFDCFQISEEKEKVTSSTKSLVPAAFVSFKRRWGAVVCAQTQQSRNPTEWLTEWAPEPRDIYWDNLALPYVHLTIRRLVIAVAFFFLTFFFMIPIAFVQTLANIEGIEKAVPFLKPLIEM